MNEEEDSGFVDAYYVAGYMQKSAGYPTKYQSITRLVLHQES